MKKTTTSKLKPITQSLQGTMVCIKHFGVLITGAPGSGKSEVALGLLDRGHQLVSDDLVDIYQSGENLMATSPVNTQGLLWIRHIGITDIKQLYGQHFIKKENSLNLLIHLEKMTTPPLFLEPLLVDKRDRVILNMTIPQFTLKIMPQSNLPLLIETLVRQYQFDQLNPSDNPFKMNRNPSEIEPYSYQEQGKTTHVT